MDLQTGTPEQTPPATESIPTVNTPMKQKKSKKTLILILLIILAVISGGYFYLTNTMNNNSMKNAQELKTSPTQ